MVSKPVIRVALLGADELVVRGLNAMLSTLAGEFELVSLKTCGQRPVDIVLVETYSVRAGGLNLSRALADPHIRRVAIYTWKHQPGMASAILVNGIAGYLCKSLTAAQLGNALRRIHDGQVVVAPDLSQRDEARDRSPSARAQLSAREEEALARVATGVSNKQIAAEMGLTVNSVKSYLRHAYAKIGVTSRNHAIVWALTNNLPTTVLDEPFDRSSPHEQVS